MDRRLLGAQDTVFAAGPPASRQYFLQSYINGSCDSIYGTSSMMQPCNDSGFLEPTFASKFGIVDIVSQPNHVARRLCD